MDNFLIRATKKNPKLYTILGLGGGTVGALCVLTGIMESLLVAGISGFLIGMGLSAVFYWNHPQP